MIKAGDIKQLIDAADPMGYLSIYLSLPPDEDRSQATIRLHSALQDLLVKTERPLHAALEAVLKNQAAAIRDITSPESSGRSRVLFLPFNGGRPWAWETQLEGPNTVVLERSPYLLPLLRLLSLGKPAGYIQLHRDRAQICHWHDGICLPISEEDLTVDDEHWRQRQSVSGPRGVIYSADRERYLQRLERWQQHKIHEFHQDLTELAAEQGWEQMIVCGPADFKKELVDDENIQYHTHIGSLSRQEMSQLIINWRVKAERADADRLQQLAAHDSKACLGTDQVWAALKEGRVEHLLVSDHTQALQRPEGMFLTSSAAPGSVTPERLLEAAFATGAKVTVLDQPLGLFGVGAYLRW